MNKNGEICLILPDLLHQKKQCSELLPDCQTVKILFGQIFARNFHIPPPNFVGGIGNAKLPENLPDTPLYKGSGNQTKIFVFISRCFNIKESQENGSKSALIFQS